MVAAPKYAVWAAAALSWGLQNHKHMHRYGAKTEGRDVLDVAVVHAKAGARHLTRDRVNYAGDEGDAVRGVRRRIVTA